MNNLAGDHPPATDRVTVLNYEPTEWHKLKSSTLKTTAQIYLFSACKFLPNTVKNAVYRSMGVDIGKGTTLATAQIDPFFPEKISIGSGTVVGMGANIFTHEAYAAEWHVGPVEIGDDVTFGHNSSTRPGITIGDGATIGAHSFVNRDVEAGEKVGGVPIETL